MKTRCEWCRDSFEAYVQYHDVEWGVPVHDDRRHFEFLILEGAQAGLSWSTILKKREGYRRAFAAFDPVRVAAFDEQTMEQLLRNPEIVRNKLKIEAAVTNARSFLELQDEFGSFDKYVWSFTQGIPIVNAWKTMQEVPSSTPISDALSKDLKKRGFRFVGTTIMYAYMQAVGMVNDHTIDCFRYKELAGGMRN